MQTEGTPRRHESALLRRLALAGVRHGPGWFVRVTPQLIGGLCALVLTDERRRVLHALRRVHGPRAPHIEGRDVLKTFCDYAACLAEGLGADRVEAAQARVDVKGREHLTEVVARGKGAVLVTAHVGPWDAAARLLHTDLNARVVLVMEPEPDAEARALHDEVRRRAGVEVLPIGGTPLDALPLLRHLKAGGLAAFQLDRSASSTRVLWTELFGRPFAVPEGPFRIAALARIPVVPLFAARTGYFSYTIEVGEPLNVAAPAGEGELLRVAARAVERLERFIASHPTQWFHFGDG
jgi:KDO2-lipid IV(A) lauroyltransferase